MSQFFASGGQRIGVSASASVLPVNIEDWTIKKAECRRIEIVVLEKTFGSPLDSKEIKLVNPKRNQP